MAQNISMQNFLQSLMFVFLYVYFDSALPSLLMLLKPKINLENVNFQKFLNRPLIGVALLIHKLGFHKVLCGN